MFYAIQYHNNDIQEDKQFPLLHQYCRLSTEFLYQKNKTEGANGKKVKDKQK